VDDLAGVGPRSLADAHRRLLLGHHVAAAGSFPVGGLACDRLEASTIRHMRGELLVAGLADDAELDARLAAIEAGELDLTLAPLISAWGRRPTEPPPALD
jgi:hypothetical protein